MKCYVTVPIRIYAEEGTHNMDFAGVLEFPSVPSIGEKVVLPTSSSLSIVTDVVHHAESDDTQIVLSAMEPGTKETDYYLSERQFRILWNTFNFYLFGADREFVLDYYESLCDKP